MQAIAKVLHLSAHLGGGVGRFLTNVFRDDTAFEHRFVLLEPPIDTQLLPKSQSWEVLGFDSIQLAHEIERADLVQIEFWNHPLLYQALADAERWPPTRTLLYSHVAGVFPPAYLPPALTELSDVLVLGTAASLNSDAAHHRQAKGAPMAVIAGFGGADRTVNVRPRPHEGFVVGYIGTADPLKLHPDTIKLCQEIRKIRPEVHFVFCTNDSSAYLREQAGGDPGFRFYERVENIEEVLAGCDVFGYPLNPRHFGTGEQALIEAMGAGLPPVVLDNPAERCIVEDGRNGIVARSTSEYVGALNLLCQQSQLCERLGREARRTAIEEYNAARTRKNFHEVYYRLLSCTKTRHRLSEDTATEPNMWSLFCLSQGPDSVFFKNAIAADRHDPYVAWKLKNRSDHLSCSKGTIVQWAKFSPGCPELDRLGTMLERGA